MPGAETATPTSGQPSFDLPGTVRRIRRRARLSQRQLATVTGLSASTVAQVEAGHRSLSATHLAALADVAGLRLVLVDTADSVVPPMRSASVRDEGGRRYPAHYDVRHGDEGWWYLPHRSDRPVPWFTFDRRPDVALQDDDHPAPSADDNPRVRRAQREHVERVARAARQRWARVDRTLRQLTGELAPEPEVQDLCECPPGCEALLVGDDPAGQLDPHVAGCPCRCDVH
ncbi:Helix-turn-helix [Klenkia marina]|uniref:Helix-turn-helix n=1 Tax=Klenkia marina TaxID=1960309 RepID=A0A1G4XEW5_9ACTN|nr:helix-turn-helix transcriptional regulator [Klenkia marina]SCX39770.1 Helix-turn-helix [Klenkia marina]